MILTRQQKLFRGNGSAPSARAIADGIIRSLSPAAWYRNATDVVSSGGFASIWADYASSDKGLVLPGVVGNTATAPDIGSYTLDSDWTIIFRYLTPDWTPASTSSIFGHYTATGSQRGWCIDLLTTGGVSVRIDPDGAGVSEEVVNSNAIGLTDGVVYWFKVTKNKASGAVSVSYAADSEEVPSSWTSVTVPSSFSAGLATFNSSSTLTIGTARTGVLPGTFYRLIIYSDLTETTKVFDADFSAQAIGAGSFTESSSNAATVTINTSGAAPAHIGKARDLLQGTGTNQPAYAAGVFTFDGADNYMVASTWLQAQPVSIYIVCKQATWAATDRFFDGTTADSMAVIQITATPTIAPNGVAGLSNGDLAVNTRGIVACVFNGVSSSIRVNNQTKVSGNVGATSPGGFTLGSRAGGGQPGNIAAEEVVIFSAAHDDATQDSVITALNNALTVF